MSYYGLSSPLEAVRLAKLICDVLGYGSNGNAHKLLVETAQQETQLGYYLDPTPYYAGHGLCQFDKIAFDDVKRRTRKRVIQLIEKHFGVNISRVQHRELEYSPFLSMLFCRLFYRLIPHPIPKSIKARANYWKTYYNTAKGHGRAGQYILNAQKIAVKYA